MISANDTSILAMFTRYTDISNEEAEEQMNLLEHEENRGVCEALLGRVPASELDPDQRRTYYEVLNWSTDRTSRIRNEQIVARRRDQNTALRDSMVRLYEAGKIGTKEMMLYAISGPLPDRLEYQQWEPEQKEDFWLNRIEENMADIPQSRVNWEEFRGGVRHWFKFEERKANWMKEGF